MLSEFDDFVADKCEAEDIKCKAEPENLDLVLGDNR